MLGPKSERTDDDEKNAVGVVHSAKVLNTHFKQGHPPVRFNQMLAASSVVLST